MLCGCCVSGKSDAPRETPSGLTGVRSRHTAGSADDGEDVARGEDEVLLAAVLDLGAAVLAVDDLVADLDVERDALGAVVVEAAGADSEDLALLRLLLGRVRDDDAGGSGLLGLEGLDDNAVSSGLMATDTVVTFPRDSRKKDYGLWLFEAGRRRGGRPPLEERAGTFGSRGPTGRNLGLRLALVKSSANPGARRRLPGRPAGKTAVLRSGGRRTVRSGRSAPHRAGTRTTRRGAGAYEG